MRRRVKSICFWYIIDCDRCKIPFFRFEVSEREYRTPWKTLRAIVLSVLIIRRYGYSRVYDVFSYYTYSSRRLFTIRDN